MFMHKKKSLIASPSRDETPRSIIPQILHYIELMRRWIICHLIDGRAGQCHQWHLSRLEVDLLGVPFGGYGQCEGGEC